MDDDNSDKLTHESISSDEATTRPPSQLFTVRIWPEHSARGVVRWRGKVHHVPTGAWRYFQDWEVLSAFLQIQLAELTSGTEQDSTSYSA